MNKIEPSFGIMRYYTKMQWQEAVEAKDKIGRAKIGRARGSLTQFTDESSLLKTNKDTDLNYEEIKRRRLSDVIRDKGISNDVIASSLNKPPLLVIHFNSKKQQVR